MKSAYELAMERLDKQSPTVKLTPEQKAQIAELESRYAARQAEREIGLKAEITKAIQAGDLVEVGNLEQQLAAEKRKLQVELEERKEQVRNGSRV
ncbi:MAG: hypothetical protein MUE94_02305 [Verrucomicrobia bacterium]|jgi:hypothetical protein|nr:hypothetical protein [Verrucomicrobiota bacterium]